METQLRERLDVHQLLLNRIPEARSAVARANHMLRVVRPELVQGYAEGHDRGLWTRLCRLLGTDVENARSPRSRELASVHLSLGGLGLRSATRTREAAYWASWADCLFMVRNRHPVVVDRILDALNRMDELESTWSAAVAAHHLGFRSPLLRPRPHDPKIVNLEDFNTASNMKRPPE